MTASAVQHPRNIYAEIYHVGDGENLISFNFIYECLFEHVLGTTFARI